MPPVSDLKAEELGAGCIVILRKQRADDMCQDDCPEDPCPTFCKQCQDGCLDTSKYCKLEKGAYGHPVLVLGVRNRSGVTYVTFVIISALGSEYQNFGQFLEKRNRDPGNPQPLTPCSFGPKDLWTAEQEGYGLKYDVESGGVNFTKPCYLELPHRYTLNMEYFASFRPNEHGNNSITKHAYDLRFTEDSYIKIMKKLGLEKDRFVSTENLKLGKGGPAGTTTELYKFVPDLYAGALPPFDVDKRITPKSTPTDSSHTIDPSANLDITITHGGSY